MSDWFSHWTTADVAKAVVGPILSAVIAAIVALIVSIRTTTIQRRLMLDSMKNKALELAMQYPHLERDDYGNAWPNPPGEPNSKEYADDKERYDSYCCFVFNMISAGWRSTGKMPWNKIDVDDELAFKEYILQHQCYWKNASKNVHYYTQAFRNYVNGVIDDDTRKGVCK